jgi:hypothetical protein
MSDTASRSPSRAPQMLADALLRSVGGASASLRVTASNPSSDQAEVGLLSTAFYEVQLSPAVMRKLSPSAKGSDAPQWEMLISASSVQAQIMALDIPSAQALFALTLAITVAGMEYLIESVAANEAFGNVYLYRLTLREALRQSL